MDADLEAAASRLLRVLIERSSLADEAEARARVAEGDARLAARRAEVTLAEIARQGDEFEDELEAGRAGLADRERAVTERERLMTAREASTKPVEGVTA